MSSDSSGGELASEEAASGGGVLDVCRRAMSGSEDEAVSVSGWPPRVERMRETTSRVVCGSERTSRQVATSVLRSGAREGDVRKGRAGW